MDELGVDVDCRCRLWEVLSRMRGMAASVATREIAAIALYNSVARGR